MRLLASFVTGRRTKWLVPVIWIVLVVVFAPLGSKLADETDDRHRELPPESAESTEVARLLNDRFAGGQTVNGLIVYRRPGGLTAADKAQDRRATRGGARRELPLIGRPVRAVRRRARRSGLVSPDGALAYTVLTLPDDYDKLGDWGKELRDIDRRGRRRAATSASPATSASTPTSRRSSARSTPSCWSRRCCSC